MPVDLTAARQSIIRQTRTRVVASMTASIATGMRAGLAQSANQIDPFLRQLGNNLDPRNMPSEDRKNTNLAIAEQSRAEMAASYETRLVEHSTGYRPESRLVGRLGDALRDPANTSNTTDRVISFLNYDVMGREAVHWYRVNYGARGSNRGEGHQASTVTVGNAISLRDPAQPAPNSWLPQYFQAGGRGSMFFVPGSRGRHRSALNSHVHSQRIIGRRIGRGVRAAYFTDLGIEMMARRFGPEYFLTYNEFLQRQGSRPIQVGAKRMTWPVRVS